MELNKNIEDELFCLRYELNTLGMATSEHKLERWLPGFTDMNTDYDHRQRYDWVTQFAKNKSVLDIASGAGFGSYLLATKGEAKSVLGCDIEHEAVKYASIKYNHNVLHYEQQDATLLDKNQKFDVIVSFETIEHIADTEKYLEKMAQHLSVNGLFIVSTPISSVEIDNQPKNPFHVKEWGFNKFQEILQPTFKIEKIYLQLHPPRPYTRFDAIYHRFFLRNKPKKRTEIIEYVGNFNISKFGKQIVGYQILVCTNIK
jgi:2-polyprenyl-3-methyl-5-hydroxy-6-metoxy-1,4-benzoquinol methylase